MLAPAVVDGEGVTESVHQATLSHLQFALSLFYGRRDESWRPYAFNMYIVEMLFETEARNGTDVVRWWWCRHTRTGRTDGETHKVEKGREREREKNCWEGAACGLDCLLAAHLPTNEDIADGWTR